MISLCYLFRKRQEWRAGILMYLGHSITTWTKFLPFLTPYPTPPAWTVFISWAWTKTDIFDHFPPSSCPRSCWMPPNMQLQWLYDLESDHINPRHKNIVGYGVFSSKLKEWTNLRNDFSILASHLYKFEQKYCSPACTI